MNTETEPPEVVTLKARDIKPYHYGVWCIVGDPDTGNKSKPFSNTICSIKWSEDGEHLWFMLDTHNTMKVAPDEEIEVVPERGPHSQRTRDRYAEWVLPAPPKPKRTQRYDHPYRWDASGPKCGVCGAVHEPNLEPLGY